MVVYNYYRNISQYNIKYPLDYIQLKHYSLFEQRGEIYGLSDDEYYSDGDIYYDLISIDKMNCQEFIKSFTGQVYEMNTDVNEYRIEKLFSFESFDSPESGIMFEKRFLGRPSHKTLDGHSFNGGNCIWYNDGHFKLVFDIPSVIGNNVPQLFLYGRLAFTPLNWKDNFIISTIIHQNFYFHDISEDLRSSIKITEFDRDMLYTFDRYDNHLVVTFPKNRVIQELIDMAKKKITLDSCCKFTKRLIEEDITIEALEKENAYSPWGNHMY